MNERPINVSNNVQKRTKKFITDDMRELFIKLMDSGMTGEEVANKLDQNPHTIRQIYRKYKRTGIKTLQPKGPNKKRRLSSEMIQKICEWVEEDSSQTLEELRVRCSQTWPQMTISSTTIDRAIKPLGIRRTSLVPKRQRSSDQKIPSIQINDIFEELTEENKRLLNELMFANKCLNVFIKFKTFIDFNFDKLKTYLDSNDSQKFEELRKEVDEVVKTKNSIALKDNEEVVDQKPNLLKGLKRNKETNLNSNSDFLPKKIDRKKRSKRQKFIICDFEGCGRQFRKRSDFSEHINRHKGIAPFVCDDESCNKSFVSQRRLEKHTEFCHLIKEKTFKCDFKSCDKIYKTKYQLSTHKLTHSEDKPYSCNRPDCQFRTHRQDSLHIHLKVTHSTKRLFHCPVDGCRVMTKTRGALTSHSIVHATDRPFVCDRPECGKTFKTYRCLKSHLKWFHSSLEKCFHCVWPGCDYQTQNPGALRNHSAVHSNERNFLCDWPQCGKAFKLKYKLNLHLRQHNNERRYVCSWPGCQYRCVFGGNLNKHMKVHQK